MNYYLSKKDILSKLKINDSDLKKMIEEGKFPPPERINNGISIWSYVILESWIKNKDMQSDWIINNDLDLF